jgi:hypothetical protein
MQVNFFPIVIRKYSYSEIVLKFYGPQANERSGVFRLQQATGENHSRGELQAVA